jgi:hypothetical protein
MDTPGSQVIHLLLCLRRQKLGAKSIIGYTTQFYPKIFLHFLGRTRQDAMNALKDPKDPSLRPTTWRESSRVRGNQSEVQKCTQVFLNSLEGIRFWQNIPRLTKLSEQKGDFVIRIQHDNSELPDSRYFAVYKEILRLVGSPFYLSKVKFYSIKVELESNDTYYSCCNCNGTQKSIYSCLPHPGYSYAYIGKKDYGRMFCLKDNTSCTVRIHDPYGDVQEVISAHVGSRASKLHSFDFNVVYDVELQKILIPYGKPRVAMRRMIKSEEICHY